MPKAKISINNRMKGSMGRMNPRTNKIEINLKAHKKKGKIDRAELASTLKHEMLHVKQPKLTEKEVYKRSAKTKISPEEQSKLLAKLRRKSLNYRIGVAKRQVKMKRSEPMQPGALISRAQSLSSKKGFRLGAKALI